MSIKHFLITGGDFYLDTEREKLRAERKELEQRILNELPEERREYFEALMRLAQKSSNFSEEHNYYFDLLQCGNGPQILNGDRAPVGQSRRN
ncbi:MAG: hypothetical protein ROZ36_18905 [Thermincola sp.]|nr:hypothetical protein [Thermincola sp.]